MELKQRKNPRLKKYDYSQQGAYFITICTKDRECLFSPFIPLQVGADSISAHLSHTNISNIATSIIEKTFIKTISHYNTVRCPIFVIMPNHFHAIVMIEATEVQVIPTISLLVQTFKRYSTLEYIKMVRAGVLPPFNRRIWQRSFYDHIIRSEADYFYIYQYIANNPKKWEDDCHNPMNPKYKNWNALTVRN